MSNPIELRGQPVVWHYYNAATREVEWNNPIGSGIIMDDHEYDYGIIDKDKKYVMIPKFRCKLEGLQVLDHTESR